MTAGFWTSYAVCSIVLSLGLSDWIKGFPTGAAWHAASTVLRRSQRSSQTKCTDQPFSKTTLCVGVTVVRKGAERSWSWWDGGGMDGVGSRLQSRFGCPSAR